MKPNINKVMRGIAKIMPSIMDFEFPLNESFLYGSCSGSICTYAEDDFEVPCGGACPHYYYGIGCGSNYDHWFIDTNFSMGEKRFILYMAAMMYKLDMEEL